MSINKGMNREAIVHIYNEYVHACSIAQLCTTPCNPIDCSPTGSSVFGIFLHLLHLLHWQAGSLPLHHLGDTMGVTQPKKEWSCTICRDTDEPRDCCTKWSQSEREKANISYNITHMKSRKCYILTYSQNIDTDVEKKLWKPGGMEWLD